MDLDGDGRRDVISGSWPGEIFLFRGAADGTFAAPEKLRHADGKVINVGGGLQAWGDNQVIVAGDATFENEGGKQVIVYEGERFVVPEGKSGGVTGTASAVHAFDWDGDGDLDLVVGSIRGEVNLVPNEGTAKAWAFGKAMPVLAGGQALKVAGDAGPFVADWDGDGRPDLLVGAGNGSVTLFRNDGAGKGVSLAAGRTLVGPGEATYGENAPKEPRRGNRAKVCAADWNGDGRLDLLLGDIAYQKPVLPEFTAEQKTEHERLRKELAEVREVYSQLSAALEGLDGKDTLKDPALREESKKQLQEAGRKWGEIQRKLPPESENHGWVWFFPRKAPAASETSR